MLGLRCLDCYCSCAERQQDSICTFLLSWNRTIGVKDVGAMIGKLVWEGREENLLKSFRKPIRKIIKNLFLAGVRFCRDGDAGVDGRVSVLVLGLVMGS